MMQSAGPRIWSIAGSGAGHGFLTAWMGIDLARRGRPVVVLDAGAPGRGLHAYFGIERPRFTLGDLLAGRADAGQVLVKTHQRGLQLVAVTPEILGAEAARGERLAAFFAGVAAVHMLVDIGGGEIPGTLDFFNLSDEGIVVVSPNPASMQGAYRFIKRAVYRRVEGELGAGARARLSHFRKTATSPDASTLDDFLGLLRKTDPELSEAAAAARRARYRILVNQAGSEEDERAAEIIRRAAERFLGVEASFCGLIHVGGNDIEGPESATAREVRRVVTGILRPEDADAEHPEGLGSAPATLIMGLNDNVEFDGVELHVQTEDFGPARPSLTTQVFQEGRILLSRRSDYAAAPGGRDRKAVMELMRKQHFGVIREIEEGKVKIVRRP